MSAAAVRKSIWTTQSLLEWAVADFQALEIESPRLDAEILLAHALEMTRVQLYTNWGLPASVEERERFRELVKQRRERRPVAYILGEKEFYSRGFICDERALIPRPETEGLIDLALADLKPMIAMSGAPFRILDFGTGSGVIAVTLARELGPEVVQITAVDCQEPAAAIARENAERHEVGHAVEVRVTPGDFAAADLGGPFDALVSNPPYVPSGRIEELMPEVRDHEPLTALDGGADGTEVITRLCAWALEGGLKAGGYLALEIDAGHAHIALGLLSRVKNAKLSRDLAGRERYLTARL